MTLKFLAGMVSNENNQELIEIFWEAVTCNVDGILELGIERKIILLMHLLAQSKINEKFNSRIPYLKQIQELIDEIVLKDITDWEQHIIGLLKVDDTQLKKLVLQKLAHILDETIDEMVIRESVNTITSLLNIWELNRCVNIILIKIINTISDLDEELLKQVQKLQNKSLVITSMIEIVKVKPSLAKEAFSVLKKLIIDHNIEDFIKCEIASSMAEIVKVMPSEEIITGLKELLNNPNCYVRYAAVWKLSRDNRKKA
ncbi:hypothetical protein O6R16_07640 [Candidatus Rickettsia tasmanensis]